MREMEETQSNVMRTLEEVPTQTYIGMALASILASAFFFIIGRRSTALFIGQWPPTFIAFALAYKLLHPSSERPIEQMREMAAETRSRISR
ncbi:MAG: hypothetical protein ACOX87_09270 [Chloroflexota bacterium]|jgi:Na+-transporting NADH:ubiquinone oxidoreductase subunit NqrB